MNVLLLTNHLKDYAGSEIQILELYRYFKLKCNKVMVYANVIENPIAAYFDKCDLCSDAQQINPCDYEIIWSQHGVFSLLFDKEENSVFAAKKLGHILLQIVWKQKIVCIGLVSQWRKFMFLTIVHQVLF